MRRTAGFTLVELMVVMAIIATLLSLVAPRFLGSVDRYREAALRMDLRIMRDAIDKFRADRNEYPPSLDALVQRRYLREIPPDPITDSTESWVLVEHPNQLPGVYDVRSGAEGQAQDGSEFRSW